MKVAFISNFLTPHQEEFCLEMNKRLGENFKFISTVKIFDWRLELGFKDLDKEYDFVIRAYENSEEYEKAKKWTFESDIVMIGSATEDLMQERLKEDKIIFRYRSRIYRFPNGILKTITNKEEMKLFWDRHIKYRKNKNLYLLTCNGYGANDFNLFGLYKNKMYKWGYFLKNEKYNIDELMNEKEKNDKIEILWVSRFIKLKHPEIPIKLAKRLKEQNYNFIMRFLGTGELEEKMRNAVKKYNLEDVIDIVGQVPNENVKDYMKKANIFIFTSDKREGWGAVMNESMSTGCTVIANQKIGSVPFLINHGQNGFMYNTYNQLEEKVKLAIENKEIRRKLGIEAYNTINGEWSASNATENLINLFESILNKSECNIKSGPASKAYNYKIIKNI